jgi:transposase
MARVDMLFPDWSKQRKMPKPKTGRNQGVQRGRIGTTLQKVDDSDVIEPVKIDRRRLPSGRFHDLGYQARQVFDIDISKVVIESGHRYLKMKTVIGICFLFLKMGQKRFIM